MSTTMSQKEYLKKYLSGSELDKKKKKKKKKDKISSHNKGMRIIEDSLDLKTVPYGYKEDDDNPTVAEVTYDDPKLKVMEEFEANKRWKRLEKPHHTQDGQESPSRSPPFRRRHDSPSPSRKVKGEVGTQRKVRHDSGSPPPTRKAKNESSPARKGRHDSESPPRKFRRNTDSPRRSTHDSDSSPPRKTRSDSDDSPPWRKTRHDSDSSPSRGRHDSDSSPGRRDSSPPRRPRHDSKSPPRRTRHDSGTPPWRVRHESDSPRPNIHNTDSPSAGTKKTRTYSVSSDDGGYTPPYPPPARPRKDSDSSLSDGEKKKASTSAPPQRPTRHDSSASPPPPVRRKRHDSDASPPRRHDSDASPPRRHDSDLLPGGRKLSSNTSDKQNKTSKSRDLTYYSDSSDSDSSDSPFAKAKKNKELKVHPKNKEQQQNVKGGVGNARTADRSPKRRQFKGDKVESDSSPPRRKRHDSDSSPPRKKRFNSDSSPAPQRHYDSDASPPRQKRHDSDSSPARRKRYDSDSSPVRRKRHDSDSSPARRKRHSDSDASPPRIKKGKPGFSPPPRRKGEGQGESGQMRPERKMTTQEYLSARKKGRLKKDTPEDIARKEREAALQQQAEDKHQQWKHGVKQVQDYKKKAASDAHEMGKAFTRTADDADMNAHLKTVARKEDPMLEYLVKKDTKGSKVPVKPVYKGSFPPNRLDIRPGYRWDGVDRSNGFEKRWFEHQNNKRAHNEDAYKWSVSDM